MINWNEVIKDKIPESVVPIILPFRIVDEHVIAGYTYIDSWRVCCGRLDERSFECKNDNI